MGRLFVEGISIDWGRIPSDSYLREIPSLRNLNALPVTDPITIFTGENGSGKSTLLEAIAIAAGFNPEGGSRNYHFSTHASHSELYEAIRLIRSDRREKWGYFLRAESYYNVETAEMDYALPGYSDYLHEMSHGESFLYTLQKNVEPWGLYFLDEPEAAMSPQMQLTLLVEIHNAAAEGAQFFMASHSPILQGIPGARILSFDGGAIRPCAWEETGSCRIMKMFLENRERMLHYLLQ